MPQDTISELADKLRPLLGASGAGGQGVVPYLPLPAIQNHNRGTGASTTSGTTPN